MTKKRILLIAGIAVLCLVICLCAVMCSSAERGETKPSEPVGTTGSGTMTYTIQVSAETGTPLEEIGVYIYTDSTMAELVWFAKTDAEGMLTFTDIPSDNFVAVLADVPAGYLVEEYYPLTGENTQIKLSAGLMEGDLTKITYKLGDLMLDFTDTGPDGTEYKFSELLKEKKAVILNFWYLECEPCKSEFPYLQEAYEQYGEDVALLVMNPVNQDNAKIEQFRKDNDYTFPMMACDPNWQNAMQIAAYPTTVVIDRFGYITLMHRGTIPETETFEAMMDYFSAEDYEHTIFKSLEELEEAAGVEPEVGTAENPVEIGLTSSFQVTVEPGQEMHYNIYRITTPVFFSMSNPNAYVIYNGRQYPGPNISFSVSTDGPNSPAKLIFGNNGTDTQTYTVYLGHKQGSPDNPYSLNLNAENKAELSVNVDSGNSQGVWYSMGAPDNGFLTIEVESVTAGTKHEISVTSITTSDVAIQTNLSEEGTTDEETGRQKLTVKVFKGGRVKISFGSLDVSYPAINFRVLISFVEGDVTDSANKKLMYSVNVTDENRKPIAGIMLDIDMDGTPVTITTDETGAASTKLDPDTYTVTMRQPNGYRARTLTYKLTEKTPSISVKLQTVITKDYTVKVVGEDGKPVAEAQVTIGNMSLQTDENGVAVFKLEEGSYTATVAKVGYYDVRNVVIPDDTREAQVTLVVNPEANFINYTVYVKDYDGKNVSGAKVVCRENGANATTVNGVAVINMEPGNYTVNVTSPYYVYSGNIAVTETTPETTLYVAKGITAAAETLTVHVGTDSNGFAITSNYSAYPVSSGAVYITLTDYQTSYFLFNPGTASGLYEITVTDPNAILSDWSTSAYCTLKEDNLSKISINHKDTNNGVEYVIGIKGAANTVLVITRVGDFIKDDSDLPKIDYVGTHTPVTQNITVPSGKKLTYVDVVNGKTSDYKMELHSDGFYYLEDGTKLYVHLGQTNTTAKPPYMCLSDMIGVTDSYAVNTFYSFATDGNGVKTHMERYENLLISYCNAVKSSSLGLYPLTEDLVHMLINGGNNKGWYDQNNANYIFKDSEQNALTINTDLAWMFAVCYFK